MGARGADYLCDGFKKKKENMPGEQTETRRREKTEQRATEEKKGKRHMTGSPEEEMCMEKEERRM